MPRTPEYLSEAGTERAMQEALLSEPQWDFLVLCCFSFFFYQVQHTKSTGNGLKYWMQWLTSALLHPTVPDVSFTGEETDNKLSMALHYTEVREVEWEVSKTSTQSEIEKCVIQLSQNTVHPVFVTRSRLNKASMVFC